MILSKPDIRNELDSGRLAIDPFPDPSQIGPISINLKLGRSFTILKKAPKFITSIRVDQSLFHSKELWERKDDQASFKLEPGAFVLGHTLERVVMPNHLMGMVEGRSSWARVGVVMHLTAPKIDPGFEGTITLEIVNFGPAIVELVPEEDEPVQLMLMPLTRALERSSLYGAGERDAFQGQTTPLPIKG